MYPDLLMKTSEFNNVFRQSSEWFGGKEANKFQIWSDAVLCEVTVSDTLSLAEVFSREGKGTAILNHVQRNGVFITFNYFVAQVEIKDVRVLWPYIKCLH